MVEHFLKGWATRGGDITQTTSHFISQTSSFNRGGGGLGVDGCHPLAAVLNRKRPVNPLFSHWGVIIMGANGVARATLSDEA